MRTSGILTIGGGFVAILGAAFSLVMLRGFTGFADLSGLVVGLVVLALGAGIVVAGRRRARHLLIGGAVAVTAAVAASRVLLDLHWLSDVVGGVALGWAWFALCAVAFGGRLLVPTAAVDTAAAEAAAPRAATARTAPSARSCGRACSCSA